MCRAAPSAHGSPSTENRRSRKNRGIARKSLHRSAGAPPFNVQHTRTDWEEDPAARAVRRPRATPLSLSQPFSPGRRRCSGAGPSPRSARTATGPLLRRDVHFALENDGWNCTFECEVHVSASGAPGGRRRDPCRPSRGPQRRRLSKSVAKARIEPERGRLFGDGFEGVGREGCGGGLLGRVLLVRRVVAEASECVSPLRLDGASRMVGRRLACRDAVDSRARHLTREIVT